MPCKQNDIRVELPMKKGVRGASLVIKQKTTTIDATSIRSKFPSNYIHSMDAYIVNSLYELLFRINKRLSSHNIFINCYTNHDTFMITLIPFLRIMVQDCYTTLIKSNYIETLRNNPEIYKEICASFFNKDTSNFHTIVLSKYFLK